MPKDFRAFTGLSSSRPFVQYLRDRGFIPEKITHHALRYAVDGPFRGRIIFPVVFEGKLVSWTGRALSKKAKLRYKAWTADPDTAAKYDMLPALGPINNYLLGYDMLMKTACDRIFLCEGPFDALKMDYLGSEYGICATCFFTSSPSKSQIGLLHQLLPRFNQSVLVLDRGTEQISLPLSSKLRDLRITTMRLPDHIKDPGELTAKDLHLWLKS